jgi:hypothetical protein
MMNFKNWFNLLEHFESHGKINGPEDIVYLNEFFVLLEDDEFDPFSHLQDSGKISEEDDCVLTISKPNSKLSTLNAPSLSLPAGYACPFADICKSKAHKSGGKFADGKSIKDFGDIRCFAASAEARLPDVRKNRWRNYDLLKKVGKKGGVPAMANLLLRSIAYYESANGTMKIFRVHDSGDFYNQDYFDAWVEAASKRSDILFYAYTKSLPFWAGRKEDIPSNLRLIASEGGKADELIDKEGFRKAVIVKDKGEAIEKKLNIDVNDFLAAFGEDDFALLLHGVQSKESGNNSLSMKNSKLIKDTAKQFGVDSDQIEELLGIYTKAA